MMRAKHLLEVALQGCPKSTKDWEVPCIPFDPGCRFLWDVTAKGLLTIKLHALERVLQQRQEILAALQPVPAEVGAG
jgi:hypothetical protein